MNTPPQWVDNPIPFLQSKFNIAIHEFLAKTAPMSQSELDSFLHKLHVESLFQFLLQQFDSPTDALKQIPSLSKNSKHGSLVRVTGMIQSPAGSICTFPIVKFVDPKSQAITVHI